MAVEITPNTPLAEALNAAIQPKLVEVGWGSGGSDDSALSEYIILMLVNGKTQDEIASELSGDLLNLGPDDPGAREFAAWLFEQIQNFSAQLTGGTTNPPTEADGATGGAEAEVSAEDDMDMTSDAPAQINAPSGPRAMRTGNERGGRGRRMMGQINRALDRSTEAVLHRVRGPSGTDRVSTHTRAPPTGPRMGAGRLPRGAASGRATNLATGLASMGRALPGGPGAMNANGAHGWQISGQQPQQAGLNIYAMLEQQAQMMQQMQQQILMQGGGFPQQQQPGKSLFDRVRRPHDSNSNFRKGPHQPNGHGQPQGPPQTAQAAEGEDVEMAAAKREPANPEETVCKYNLACTNRECKFAHQSPAAPPGTAVDVQDVCTFGAACKNRKCVGRHPSPASKAAHQSEQDCKFYPNCQNPRCPFRHPTMPPCRNGGDCAVANCKFTHVKTACKFRPCTNRFCPFKHEDGQRGVFHDKVWTPSEGGDAAHGQQGQHVSERKFVDEGAVENVVLVETDNEMGNAADASVPAAQQVATAGIE